MFEVKFELVELYDAQRAYLVGNEDATAILTLHGNLPITHCQSIEPVYNANAELVGITIKELNGSESVIRFHGRFFAVGKRG